MLPCMSFRTIELFVFGHHLLVNLYLWIVNWYFKSLILGTFSFVSPCPLLIFVPLWLQIEFHLCIVFAVYFFLTDLLSLLHRSPCIRCYSFFFQSFPLPQGFSCSKVPLHYTTFHWCSFHHLRSLVQKSRSSVRSDDTFINLK